MLYHSMSVKKLAHNCVILHDLIVVRILYPYKPIA